MTGRPATATIDLDALRHNLARVRECAPRSSVLAVIKANAYGHGALRAARALHEADAFAVASLDEAEPLRAEWVDKPVSLLSGFFGPEEIPEISRLKLQPVVHQFEQVAMLEATPAPAPFRVWIKVDSGMHRLGFAPEEIPKVVARLQHLPSIAGMDFMTHFARADEHAETTSAEQTGRFEAAVHAYAVVESLANSAAILRYPQTHRDWVRPGIMLYGVSPLVGRVGADERLRPVMTLASRLVAIRTVAKGDAIGYGGAYVCPEDMRVGVVAIGYGDGYPRHAPTGTPVLVNGRRSALVGRVSMDLITVDLRGHDAARVGDPVTLWGGDLPVEEVAEHAETIAYELLCNLSSRVAVREVGA